MIHTRTLMQIANAPCSWGVLEFDGLERSAPCAQVLDEIAATGYAGTELGDGGFMPTDLQALSAELAARALCEHGYDDSVVVEQDVLPGMGSPAESAAQPRLPARARCLTLPHNR
jgi:hypothetical protein